MHRSDRMYNDLQCLQDCIKFLQKHYTLAVLSLKYFRIQDRFLSFPCRLRSFFLVFLVMCHSRHACALI